LGIIFLNAMNEQTAFCAPRDNRTPARASGGCSGVGVKAKVSFPRADVRTMTHIAGVREDGSNMVVEIYLVRQY
ncbi:MAG: hypothetical protein OXH34_01440, partial [Bacteroidetes bacterium]|nr:hypothetical protein [Bacteroidota bacterium]